MHRKDHLCTEKGCKKLSRAEGLCAMHLRDWREQSEEELEASTEDPVAAATKKKSGGRKAKKDPMLMVEL